MQTNTSQPVRPASAGTSPGAAVTAGSAVRAVHGLRSTGPDTNPSSQLDSLFRLVTDMKTQMEAKMAATLQMASSALQSSTASTESQRLIVMESQQQMEQRITSAMGTSSSAAQTRLSTSEEAA